MANGENYHYCTFCETTYALGQECHHHEILKNFVQMNNLKGRLQTKLLNSLNEDEQIERRLQLKTLLSKSSEGKALDTILDYFCISKDQQILVIDSVYVDLKNEFKSLGDIQIHCFGSLATGLFLKDSDIDLYIKYNETSDQHNNNYIYNKLSQLLYGSELFSNIVTIRSARVPIIRSFHNLSKFSVDINVSCTASLANADFTRHIVCLDKRLHKLLIFLKIWGKNLKIIDKSCLTSYCLVTLAIFFLQQPTFNAAPVLPSIKEMQNGLKKNIVEGINYAFDLRKHYKPLPTYITVLDLIKRFFAFYLDLDFENLLIAPFLGKTVPLNDFLNRKFYYPAYNDQIDKLSQSHNEELKIFQTNHIISVQDTFALTHNIGRSVTSLNLSYIRKCLNYSYKICNDSNKTENEIYGALLLDIVVILNNNINPVLRNKTYKNNCGKNDPAIRNNTDSKNSNDTYNIPREINRTEEPKQLSLKNEVVANLSYPLNEALNFSIYPSKIELKWLINQGIKLKDNSLEYKWADIYMETIIKIIKKIFLLNMQKISSAMKDIDSDKNYVTSVWKISGNVDCWTSRTFQRQNFWKYQVSQTTKMYENRLRDATFAVQLNCILKINIHSKNKGMNLSLFPEDGNQFVCKKDPMCKFFAILKATLTNFNIKEDTQILKELNKTCFGTSY